MDQRIRDCYEGVLQLTHEVWQDEREQKRDNDMDCSYDHCE
jgi:hypothetical protein